MCGNKEFISVSVLILTVFNLQWSDILTEECSTVGLAVSFYSDADLKRTSLHFCNYHRSHQNLLGKDLTSNLRLRCVRFLSQ